MLSKILDLNIESSRVFMATSPMRELAKRFGNKRVRYRGRQEQANKLATAFGFQNYVTLREYVKDPTCVNARTGRRRNRLSR